MLLINEQKGRNQYSIFDSNIMSEPDYYPKKDSETKPQTETKNE
ncbi:hypothetical protein [Shewanella violacea]|uniref:Uncharacterized protein n=1 Tax=Shewanella violacea (strain JCM 10179 / CIP 106290 / LMG 19151 / DSS12) TaxID=637905 RepID=D4ZCA3_SHEVD|nr:hypothetical protein [Shewanella violacea]BAJ03648.1 hypothetical protein SVI_3677 [Shewanella violacea DSS12]